MKKIIALSLTYSLLGIGSIGVASAAEDILMDGSEGYKYDSEVETEEFIQEEEDLGNDGEYTTRTMRARHAITTGSPQYADEELENAYDDRQMEEADNELDNSRTYDSRKALDTTEGH